MLAIAHHVSTMIESEFDLLLCFVSMSAVSSDICR